MKRWIKHTIMIIVAVIIARFVVISIDDFVMQAIFTVSGIMFSLGLGLIVSFNMNGVKNKSYIQKIRQNLNGVRNSFILYFTISTVAYVLNKYIMSNSTPIFNWSVLFCLFMLYSIVYFIINFIELQRLNNDIFDKINKENKD